MKTGAAGKKKKLKVQPPGSTLQNFPVKKDSSKFPGKKRIFPRKISRKKNDLSRILEFHYAV